MAPLLRTRLTVAALIAATAVLASSARAVEPTAAQTHTTSAGDVFIAGGKAELRNDVTGDAFLAGGRVSLEGAVLGDAFAAGGSVEANKDVSEDLYAFGGNVLVAGNVGRNLRSAAGNVSIARGAKIAGKATLAGGNVDVKGAVGSHLTAAGGSVRVDAPVAGNVEVSAREVEVGPQADIGGTLTYWSAQQARIDPGAKIAGAVQYRHVDMPEAMPAMGIAAMVVGGVLMFFGLAVLGALLLLIFPNFTATVERTFAANPGKSFALGLAVLFGLPLLALLLIFTIIGIPAGLLVLFLYPFVLMIGYVTAALFVGDKAVSWLRKGKPMTIGMRILGFVGALVLFALLQAVPVLGALIAFVVVLMGLGAWVVSMYRRYHVAPAA